VRLKVAARLIIAVATFQVFQVCDGLSLPYGVGCRKQPPIWLLPAACLCLGAGGGLQCDRCRQARFGRALCLGLGPVSRNVVCLYCPVKHSPVVCSCVGVSVCLLVVMLQVVVAPARQLRSRGNDQGCCCCPRSVADLLCCALACTGGNRCPFIYMRTLAALSWHSKSGAT
jgi:hypothetical protein